MNDKENTIKRLEHLSVCFSQLNLVSYNEAYKTVNDALALLKEQEKVEPMLVDHITFGTHRKCSKCDRYLFPGGDYCPHCGMPVNWDYYEINRVRAVFKIIVTGGFFDDNATEETLQNAVERTLDDAGFDVCITLLKDEE